MSDVRHIRESLRSGLGLGFFARSWFHNFSVDDNLGFEYDLVAVYNGLQHVAYSKSNLFPDSDGDGDLVFGLHFYKRHVLFSRLVHGLES